MAQTWKSQDWQSRDWRSLGDEWDAPVFCYLGTLLAGAAGLFLLLYFLSQPTINLNPGVAAYVAPPATRLVPLPRQSDAPELAELAVDPPSPLTAYAKAQASDPQAKRGPPARKHPRADPGPYDQRGPGFVQQWNFGSHAGSGGHAWSGGPKSWF
jgi:hypothetical protein